VSSSTGCDGGAGEVDSFEEREKMPRAAGDDERDRVAINRDACYGQHSEEVDLPASTTVSTGDLPDQSAAHRSVAPACAAT
jgi:hypothetical protein